MTHALERPDALAHFRPGGHLLMLMLRAALADDGKGGPWLVLARSREDWPRRVYVHHISVTPPAEFSNDRLVMCDGTELLGKFLTLAETLPARVMDPSRAELRALGDWCVTRVNAPLWDADTERWLREYMGPLARDRRADERDAAASRVRALRWLMAEEWLR